MSADNGILIRKNQAGQFEVREYISSVDYETEDAMPIRRVFDTLETACAWANEQETEYGISFSGIK